LDSSKSFCLFSQAGKPAKTGDEIGVIAGRETVEFGKRKFWSMEEVERKTDSDLDPIFFPTETAGRKTDPVLEPKLGADISVRFSFDVSGVTSAAPKLENRSSRSSRTNPTSSSEAPTPKRSISSKFPLT
jgi:hypothetical protein